jgi:SAM-dependent methyltransferase
VTAAKRPGWKRLWRHSYALGLRWLVREAPRRWPAGKVGVARLLVPLDPSRYYELGRVAEADFAGRCLDVSSPKLLPSLLHSEGRGEWLCVDLFSEEIDAWRTIDPGLELDVQDATSLPYPDSSFDSCICISVLEHVGVGKDRSALAELWRVLRPGGALHLTTDVAAVPRDVYRADAAYGEASPAVEGKGTFFKHDYSPAEIDQLVGALPWRIKIREYAIHRRPAVERWFYAHAPWSYVAGPFLRFAFADGFHLSPDATLIEKRGSGVVYLRLEKPGT